ncbi:hypothetical protein H0H87_001967 [Tephrocybe sp. NHM501043]|nr:hypothetical protein H0H87_001967 [Tephrocybe sp. NHM501043]
MSSPTPVQSFIGGIGLSLPVHALLVLNGNVFGISGFLHRAVLGGKEPACAVLGLVLGGASLIATVTFFVTGVITAQFMPGDLPLTSKMDWSLGKNGQSLLATHLAASALLCFFATRSRASAKNGPTASESRLRSRLLVFLTTGFQFALALRFSNLSEPTRVLSFLGLPLSPSFDPSLAFLAAGALPTSVILYRYFFDKKLIVGAALFGIGWGLAGICPGPGLVNLGRALSTGSGIAPVSTWLVGVTLGGLLA